ncbi:MAG: hypothetical protein WC119_00275 [Synergistaceae bacterium]
MKSDMIDIIQELVHLCPETNPNFRALILLGEEFRKHDLPIKYIGKIKIDVDENFFEDKPQVEEFMRIMGEVISKIYKAIVDEFGEEDAKYIFSDMMEDFSIIHKL